MLSVRLSVLRSYSKERMIKRIICAFSIFAVTDVIAAEEKAGGPVLDTASIFSWVLSTFVILSLIVALAYLLKKTRFVKVNKGTLAIENQLYVGPKQRVVIVKAGSKKVLLGVTQSQITYLTDVDDVKLEFERIMSESDVQTEMSVKENDSTKGE